MFYKDRILLPERPRLEKIERAEIVYPPMLEERILRALQHAYDELGSDEAWGDKKRAMPIIAKHISAEGREHFFSVPRDLYQIYCNTDLSTIKK